jgi:hypothetical protein
LIEALSPVLLSSGIEDIWGGTPPGSFRSSARCCPYCHRCFPGTNVAWTSGQKSSPNSLPSTCSWIQLTGRLENFQCPFRPELSAYDYIILFMVLSGFSSASGNTCPAPVKYFAKLLKLMQLNF